MECRKCKLYGHLTSHCVVSERDLAKLKSYEKLMTEKSKDINIFCKNKEKTGELQSELRDLNNKKEEIQKLYDHYYEMKKEKQYRMEVAKEEHAKYNKHN